MLWNYISNPMESSYCVDCGHSKPTHAWGGGPRCDTCDTKFSALVYHNRKLGAQRKADALAKHIADGCPDDGLVCKECCEHWEKDHDICVDCEEEFYGE